VEGGGTVKVAELTGAALDWAVGQCAFDTKVIVEDGFVYFTLPDGYRTRRCCPSTDWAQGGPIIEREQINLTNGTPPGIGLIWHAWLTSNEEQYPIAGLTPLIAAMRCFVASKLGDDIDIPKELLA
jgi:hypothetical protein